MEWRRKGSGGGIKGGRNGKEEEAMEEETKYFLQMFEFYEWPC